MTAPLRIGEAAQRLGVTPDTVRDWVRKGYLSASRTPTGQLVFDVEEVEALRRGEPQLVEAPEKEETSTPPRSDERSRSSTWKDLAPWQTEIESARASLTLDELEAERELRADERERARLAREREEQASARTEAARQRIAHQKKRVFQTLWIETEYRPRVAAAIESFATLEQVPAWLSDAEQYDLIATHARAVLAKLRDETRQREADALRAETERQRIESEKFADRMRTLFPSAVPPSRSPTPPRSVADALRRRRE
jgi:excisionase family DNA binding protein